MRNQQIEEFIRSVLENMPTDWLTLTTHRLDIYNEKLAKTEFLDQVEKIYMGKEVSKQALSELRTAYDYIRLGHPLSSIVEWGIAKIYNLKPEAVISFSSLTAPVLAVLRKNYLLKKPTLIVFKNAIPVFFDSEIIQRIYGYPFELMQISEEEEIPKFEGSIILIEEKVRISEFSLNTRVDFYINYSKAVGSILLTNGQINEEYISEIQHVRRRETIAMTPANSLQVLKEIVGREKDQCLSSLEIASNKAKVKACIREITATDVSAVVGSSGLSIQYAIVMGLIHASQENEPGKPIKIIVPPNCYGGTNDQARRIAAILPTIEVMDLPVDGGNDMVAGIEKVLHQIAEIDGISIIITEIPTNPRVEVPNLEALRDALVRARFTKTGKKAVEPIFVLDQTFCPNVHFLGEDEILAKVKTIAYVSGSKFPSGGKCTAGYATSNRKAAGLMEKISQHLTLCDNEATPLQMEILAQQMPSMNERIAKAYANTRLFVNFIQEVLPAAKINFVSEELTRQGFTPSVFSLDLPTKGNTEAERELYKREQNLRLINRMISQIPLESKYCVSYGQLKGCYWTIPATSTQGTTKEGDKDYIARVAISPDLDLEKHKAVFLEFLQEL